MKQRQTDSAKKAIVRVCAKQIQLLYSPDKKLNIFELSALLLLSLWLYSRARERACVCLCAHKHKLRTFIYFVQYLIGANNNANEKNVYERFY